MTESQNAAQPVHVPGYQARDYEVVDYQMTELPDTGLKFRGPLPSDLESQGGFFACLGAAQTLGCFCDAPYPTLVAEHVGLQALNLGYGGAGPEFFVQQSKVLRHVEKARFVILQVMSGRSQSNSYYKCGGLEYVTLRHDGRRIGAHAAFEELVWGPQLAAKLPASKRVKRRISELIAVPDRQLPSLVKEIQEAWVESSLELIRLIPAPVILVWFSQRPPAYKQRFGTAEVTLGHFPHLIHELMIEKLTPHVAGYVECVTKRGTPQPLYSRFTGKPTTVTPANDRKDLGNSVWHTNPYYPSPEMHEDVAQAIIQHLDANPVQYGLESSGGRDGAAVSANGY